jgi:hypothetical protein
MFQAVCLPTDLCRFRPQNGGIYNIFGKQALSHSIYARPLTAHLLPSSVPFFIPGGAPAAHDVFGMKLVESLQCQTPAIFLSRLL